MAKLTQKQWGDIETRYKLGDKVRDIAEHYNYSAGNISTKAKELGWIHGELKLTIQQAVVSQVDLEQKLKQLKQPNVPLVQDRMNVMVDLELKANGTSSTLLDLINIGAELTKRVVENAVDGLYIKGESANGTQYGRVTEFIKDLTSAMPAVNTTLGLDKGLEINNNTQNNLTPTIKIVRKED